jgi:hypothetical protein
MTQARWPKPKPLVDDLAVRATQRRAMLHVLALPCGKHDTAAGRPCWTIPTTARGLDRPLWRADRQGHAYDSEGQAMKPVMIPANQAVTAERAEAIAAQDEASRRLTRPPTTPPAPPSKPSAAPVKKPAPPAKPPKQPAPKPPRRAATPPVVPGGLVLSPEEVVALDRLLASHPDLKRETF